MNCKKCGEELNEYCWNCVEEMLAVAINEVNKKQLVKRPMALVVWQGDPRYEEILAARREENG